MTALVDQLLYAEGTRAVAGDPFSWEPVGLPAIAMAAVEAGHDAQAMLELAWLDAADFDEIRKVWPAVRVAMKLPVLSYEQGVHLVAIPAIQAKARAVLDGAHGYAIVEELRLSRHAKELVVLGPMQRLGADYEVFYGSMPPSEIEAASFEAFWRDEQLLPAMRAILAIPPFDLATPEVSRTLIYSSPPPSAR